jgi:polysaccharide export outer membrane protein
MRRTIIISAVLVFSGFLFAARGNGQNGSPQAVADQAGSKPSAERVPSYVLGPDDQISITALDMDEISKDRYRIDGKGNITVPLLGRVKAGGMTVEQFEAGLIEQLKTYVHDPQITVAVTEFHSQPVSVIGMVNNPGVQLLQGKKTLAEVLSLAGGIKPEAGYTVKITRKVEKGELPLPGAALDPTGSFYLAEVNLNDIVNATRPELNILVKPDDVISVPRGNMIYVVGGVKKAGGFVLNDKESLTALQALALAGGLEPTAIPKKTLIVRIKSEKERTEIPLDLNALSKGKGSDVAMQKDDIMFVPSQSQGGWSNIGRTLLESGARMAIYRLP